MPPFRAGGASARVGLIPATGRDTSLPLWPNTFNPSCGVSSEVCLRVLYDFT